MSTTQDLFCDLLILEKPVTFQMKVEGDQPVVSLTMVAPGIDPNLGIDLGPFQAAIDDIASKIGIGNAVSSEGIVKHLQGTGPLQQVTDQLLAAHMWLKKLEWVQDDHFIIGFRVVFDEANRPEVGPIALDAFGADLEFPLGAED